MSIPSSSAFVARRRAARPSASRRSISRRCCGRVAGAVGREPRVVAEPLGGEAVDSSAALRLFANVSVRRPRSTKPGLELRRLGERRAAQAELRVEQRRVPEHDRALGARRGVVADHRHRHAEQRRARARRGSRSSPRRAGTAARSRRCARAAGAAAARSRRASRRRRGRRAPRRRRRSGGSRARRPSARGAAAGRCAPCPGWSGSAFDHLRICQRCSVGVSPS